MKLTGIKTIKGIIECKTGLRIGGSKDTMHIGGIDNNVIRDPLTNHPYIPGSSIKGKIRTLLEWHLGKVDTNGDVHSCDNPDCAICKIFGTSKDTYATGPGRAIFRDSFLSDNSVEKLSKLIDKGMNLTEVKTENSINRLNGRAVNPRQTERVPAGAEFDFVINYRFFDMGDSSKGDTENFNVLLEGLKLLEKDSLGASGSRGYGQIILKAEEGSEEHTIKIIDETGKEEIKKLQEV